MNRCIQLVVLPLLLIITLVPGEAISARDLTLKDISSIEDRSKEVREKAGLYTAKANYDGETPLSMILAIQNAAKEENWDEAAKYLDTRFLPPEMQQQSKKKLLHQLEIVWSQQQVVDLSTLSTNPEGHLDDNLPAYQDLLGYIQMPKERVPVYLQRVPDEKYGSIWKISNATVTKIPALWKEYGYHPWAISLSKYLPRFEIMHMKNWQFVSFVVIVLASWYFTALVREIALKLVSYSETYKETMQRFFRVPMRMFLFFILLQWGISYLGLSINARVWLESGFLYYCALAFLGLGVIEFTFAIYRSREGTQKNTLAILRPIVTTIKIIVVIVVALNWLHDAGFNITTILTGLGIGSLAVALAAQKTLENIFGAFTLYIARPIKPGNLCKFGGVLGIVEEIGLRSTTIRKLNRTVVHVPNSIFASSEVENYSAIDRRHYRKELRLRLDSTPDQIRQLLIELRKLIFAHPRTLDIAARVRFEDIERDAFLLKINAYIATKSLIEYKAIAEDLNLRVLEIVIESGVQLAIPEQQLYLARGKSTDPELAEQASASIKQLSDEGRLPFPNFSADELDEFKNSLSYPPEGAPKPD